MGYATHGGAEWANPSGDRSTDGRRRLGRYVRRHHRARKAEAAIRNYAEREQLFIAAVEFSNDAIVTKTLDGVITGWNQAAERLFGFTRQGSDWQED